MRARWILIAAYVAMAAACGQANDAKGGDAAEPAAAEGESGKPAATVPEGKPEAETPANKPS